MYCRKPFNNDLNNHFGYLISDYFRKKKILEKNQEDF